MAPMAPSEATPVDVLVVGGGSTALTMALDLAQYDVSCVVLDQPGPERPTPRLGEVSLHSPSVAVLDRLTGGAVSSAGRAWSTTRTLVGRSGFNPGEPLGKTTVAPREIVNVEPVQLQRVLRGQIDLDNRIQLLPDQQVVRLGRHESAGDERTTITAQSTLGTRQSWSARFIVAADGPESAVRDLLGLPFDGPPHATAVLIADVTADLPRPDERLVVLDPPGGGWVVEILPLPGRRWRFTWIIAPTKTLPTEDVPELVADHLRAFLGTDALFDLADSALVISRQRVAPRFTDGPVFLAGSAAHTAGSPIGSRSLNSGIQDADNLAWKIAYAVHGQAGPGLVESYEPERRGAALVEFDEIAAALETLSPRDRWARLRRRAVLASTARRLDVSGLPRAPVYRESPVVQPGCGGPAPDLPVRDLAGWSGTLRSLRGGPMVVMAIGPTAEDARDLAGPIAAQLPASGLPPVRVVAGVAAEASEGLDVVGAALGNLLVVRPDGVLAWKVNGENDPIEVAHTVISVLQMATGH